MYHRPLTLVFLVLLVFPAASIAASVQPGVDAVKHVSPSWWDFGSVPLPADFFGPGSDPFDGGVPADASVLPPVPECPGDLGGASMLIERLNLASLPSVPSSDVIDVEIIAMSLVSSSPIIVTYNGGQNPAEWMVEITPSSSIASTGTMTIQLDHPEGGVFNTEITVQPHFTFTRVSDSAERTLDGAGTYQDVISATNVPWVHSDPDLSCPSCASNFIPGHNGTNTVAFNLTGTSSQHTVKSSCVQAVIPTLSQLGLALALAILVMLGIYVLARRRTVCEQVS